jgi:hypothetical protein
VLPPLGLYIVPERLLGLNVVWEPKRYNPTERNLFSLNVSCSHLAYLVHLIEPIRSRLSGFNGADQVVLLVSQRFYLLIYPTVVKWAIGNFDMFPEGARTKHKSVEFGRTQGEERLASNNMAIRYQQLFDKCIDRGLKSEPPCPSVICGLQI